MEKKSFFCKRVLINLIKTLIGTLLIAISIDFFLLPNQISVGGFSGIGTIIYYLFKIPVGTAVLILNIPLFFMALFRNGKKFFIDSIFGTFCLSFFLNLFENKTGVTYSGFLACIYGGVLSGLGTTFVLNANTSTGGSDLLAQILKSYRPNIKTGNVIIILDTIIVIASTIIFKQVEIGLYSAIAIFIMGKVLDIFFEGIDFAKMLIIISPKFKEISEKIGEQVKRGSTSLYGKGMYMQNEKEILLCVASRNEVIQIRQIINKIDKNAFLIITNAREVYGEGFKK